MSRTYVNSLRLLHKSTLEPTNLAYDFMSIYLLVLTDSTKQKVASRHTMIPNGSKFLASNITMPERYASRRLSKKSIGFLALWLLGRYETGVIGVIVLLTLGFLMQYTHLHS